SSLPGPHGIGDLGPAAYAWIDKLARAQQRWWQILPLGPTGYADSPYQCLSAFAGNPDFLSLERLVEDGLLERGDLPRPSFEPGVADYDRARPLKLEATAAAYERLRLRVQGSEFRVQWGSNGTRSVPTTDEFEEFCRGEAEWLDAFALFIALKE